MTWQITICYSTLKSACGKHFRIQSKDASRCTFCSRLHFFLMDLLWSPKEEVFTMSPLCACEDKFYYFPNLPQCNAIFQNIAKLLPTCFSDSRQKRKMSKLYGTTIYLSILHLKTRWCFADYAQKMHKRLGNTCRVFENQIMGKSAAEIFLSWEALNLEDLKENYFSRNIQFSGTGSLQLIKIIIFEMIVQIIQELLVIHF